MFCPVCKKHFNEGFSYCPNCGNSGLGDTHTQSGSFLKKTKKVTLDAGKKKDGMMPERKKMPARNSSWADKLKQGLFDIFSETTSDARMNELDLKKMEGSDSQIGSFSNSNHSSESELLRAFKKEMKVGEMFSEYKGYNRVDEAGAMPEEPALLELRNKTGFTYMVRITGIGNPFYEEFILKGRNKKLLRLKASSYTIESGILEGDVIHARDIAEKEEWVHKKSPFNGRFQSDHRIVALKAGKYKLSLGRKFF